jgi:hypothetical protein
MEESLIKAMFSLIREIQLLRKKVERGDFDETQRIEKELNQHRELTLK